MKGLNGLFAGVEVNDAQPFVAEGADTGDLHIALVRPATSSWRWGSAATRRIPRIRSRARAASTPAGASSRPVSADATSIESIGESRSIASRGRARFATSYPAESRSQRVNALSVGRSGTSARFAAAPIAATSPEYTLFVSARRRPLPRGL